MTAEDFVKNFYQEKQNILNSSLIINQNTELLFPQKLKNYI